ncbi:four helix bundle protein [Candidatus Saganbacteria bacterium]|nr:four helix bundle protein [Candidatus Saganbacteria bacterium]
MVEARKERDKRPIRSFLDLEVYQDTYRSSILILTEVIPRLPKTEQDDLGDQMKRACKAVPRLIAEGYSKRHQNRGFQKYLDDALAESNEMIVCLSHCKDVYGRFMNMPLINQLLDTYDKSSRQIYNLSKAWRDFKML